MGEAMSIQDNLSLIDGLVKQAVAANSNGYPQILVSVMEEMSDAVVEARVMAEQQATAAMSEEPKTREELRANQ
jgi:hypothetical protein